MNNEKTPDLKIKLQQDIAQEILSKLEILDPYGILAGGAPRSWYLGKPANDLDFYICFCPCNMESRLKPLGLQVSRMSCERLQNSAYPEMQKIQDIFEGDFNGQAYQIMVMSELTMNCVVSEFGTSVCEAWWKHGRIQVTDAFKLSHFLKTIYTKPDYSAKVKHVDKMRRYFPNYKVVPVSEMEDDVKKLASQLGANNNLWSVVSELEKREGDK